MNLVSLNHDIFKKIVEYLPKKDQFRLLSASKNIVSFIAEKYFQNRICERFDGISPQYNILNEIKGDSRLEKISWRLVYKELSLVDFEFSRKFKGHTDNVRSLIQLSDGRIASGSNDKTVIIWNANGTVGQTHQTRTFVNCLIQLSDGRIASGSADTTVFIWKPKKLDFNRFLKG